METEPDATGSSAMPPDEQRLSLEELLAQVAPENRWPEIGFGTPQGKEIW
jgi:antitoxin component of MazEF toxin-antitoxin module